MSSIKSQKNKTIDFNIDEKKYLENNIILVNKEVSIRDIKNKTIFGDTFKTLEYLPDKFVDLLIVDPPYNLTKNYHGNKFNKTNVIEYKKYTDLWIRKLLHILKDNATIYVCCDWKSSLVIEEVLSKYFYIQNRITWQREKGRGSLMNWKNSMEDIWFATASKKYKFNIENVKEKRRVIAPYKVDGKPKDWEETKEGNFRLSYPSNFWNDITIPYWSMAENTAHPTQKPEKLIAKLILASSDKNDFVFDPFLGSGTTSVVAKKLGRKYCGIEFNKQYCLWAEYRLEIAETDNSIQGYRDNVFWERNTLSEQLKLRKKNG